MIKCDICNKDLTKRTCRRDYNGGEDFANPKEYIKLLDRTFCFCYDCSDAVYKWITSPECKAYCLKEHIARSPPKENDNDKQNKKL